jgi:hypothetical protein
LLKLAQRVLEQAWTMDQQAKVLEHACAKDDSNARSGWSTGAIFSPCSASTGKRSEMGNIYLFINWFHHVLV